MKDNKVFMSPAEQAEYERTIHAFDDLKSEDTDERPEKENDDKQENKIEQGELF